MTSPRPTRADLEAAEGRSVRDVIARGLAVLFCGINPGLYSAAVGHHFARPGNRFWPALYASGFTAQLLAPTEEHELLHVACGVTNLVARATATAAELVPAELIAGRDRLARKVQRYQPRWVAVLGIGAYRVGFDRPKALLGRQPEVLAGAHLWVLPNPSGINANHQPGDLRRVFRQLRVAAGLPDRRQR
jgi:TDG/mug DNA glycosylase family protein